MSTAQKKTDIRFPNPTTIEAALAVFEQMRIAVETAEAQVDIFRKESEAHKLAAENLRGSLEGAKDTIEHLRATRGRVGQHADDLAVIYARLKAGRVIDAMFDLERVLQFVDPDARARCGAPIFPAAGSFSS